MGTSRTQSNFRGTCRMRSSSTADLEILEQELVQMARKEEMDFMEKFCVYEDATIEECFAETVG